MSLYDAEKVRADTAQARRMCYREFPKMFGYLLFFYGLLGSGIPWRMSAARDVVLRATKASLFFGVASGVILLFIGTVIMSIYLVQKAPYTDFSPAASLTMLWSFRVFGIVGVPLALWDVFRVVLPVTGSIGATYAEDWWLLLIVFGVIAGFFGGRAIGGLIALQAIWLCGNKILKQSD
jgi:uncharacterized Tic20 family protein